MDPNALTGATAFTVRLGGILLTSNQRVTSGDNVYTLAVNATAAGNLARNNSDGDSIGMDITFTGNDNVLRTLVLARASAPSAGGGLTRLGGASGVTYTSQQFATNIRLIPASSLTNGKNYLITFTSIIGGFSGIVPYRASARVYLEGQPNRGLRPGVRIDSSSGVRLRLELDTSAGSPPTSVTRGEWSVYQVD